MDHDDARGGAERCRAGQIPDDRRPIAGREDDPAGPDGRIVRGYGNRAPLGHGRWLRLGRQDLFGGRLDAKLLEEADSQSRAAGDQSHVSEHRPSAHVSVAVLLDVLLGHVTLEVVHGCLPWVIRIGVLRRF